MAPGRVPGALGKVPLENLSGDADHKGLLSGGFRIVRSASWHRMNALIFRIPILTA